MTTARLAVAVLVCLPAAAAAQDNLPYPQGRAFPLGLYSIETLEEMRAEQVFGWNICHSYGETPEYLDLARQGGMRLLAHLEHGEEGAVHKAISDLVGRAPVGWWDFPEEMRYWRPDEMRVVTDLAAWTRQHDPDRRPNFMYHAGHYDAEALSKYVPYLDIIGAGAYTEYAHMPHAWVRWRMEQTITGIELGGAKVGANYLQGEKTPIGIPMLFYSPADMDVISPVEAYHDFYSCLAAGARGILLFSYWHKRDQGMLQPSYDAYARAASEVSGPVGLGQALLFGTEVKLGCEVTEGPPRTWSFRPYGVKEDISYPSLNVLGRRYEGKLYIIAVNSSEEAVKGRLTGLPAGVTALTTPFEKQLDENKKPLDKPRELSVQDGTVEDAFTWLGVHVYVGDMP